jgi:hypothetical protein
MNGGPADAVPAEKIKEPKAAAAVRLGFLR